MEESAESIEENAERAKGSAESIEESTDGREGSAESTEESPERPSIFGNILRPFGV
jgi:hypothetical protein